MSAQIIEKDGKPEYAIVPYGEYLQLIEAAESKDDLALFRDAMDAIEEAVPAEVVNRLLSGENAVKVWREYRGLTQKDLADACAISDAYISQIESGKPASLKVTSAIAHTLGVELSDLI